MRMRYPAEGQVELRGTATNRLEDGEDWLPAPINLLYDRSQPMQVKASFPDEGTHWVFARDLLRDGLLVELPIWAGIGDVRASVTGERENLVIELRGRDAGTLEEKVMWVRLPAVWVAEFLTETRRIVGFGEEVMDLDRDLQRLLENG